MNPNKEYTEYCRCVICDGFVCAEKWLKEDCGSSEYVCAACEEEWVKAVVNWDEAED